MTTPEALTQQLATCEAQIAKLLHAVGLYEQLCRAVLAGRESQDQLGRIIEDAAILCEQGLCLICKRDEELKQAQAEVEQLKAQLANKAT